jgi:glycosyltransferase involved in cell wall biosynthesis
VTSRVLIFTGTASQIGGVETWIDRLCGHLRSTDLLPIVGLAKGMVHHNPQRFKQFHPELDTIEIDGRGLTSEGRIRALTRCVRHVNPTIAIPMSLVEANQAITRCKEIGQDVRLVTHAQGNLPAMLADLRFFEPVIDHVVCPGRLTQHVLCSWGGFNAERVTHVPNGAAPSQHERVPNTKRVIRIGYVGRFSQVDKRVLDIIPFVEKLRARHTAFSMKIAGQGSEERTLREALGGVSEVAFCGSLTQDQLYRDFYPHIDVLVLFSASEAFGIVLAEAMMNGVVPVTSQYVGFSSERLVVHEQNGLSFPVGDTEAAVEQVDRLARDATLLDQLSEGGKRLAQSKYSWQKCLTEWERVLRDVAYRPVRRSGGKTLSLWPDPPGRLDRLGVPSVITDGIRRVRRRLIGPAVPPGGTEWPLHNVTYSTTELEEVATACEAAEQLARTQYLGTA